MKFLITSDDCVTSDVTVNHSPELDGCWCVEPPSSEEIFEAEFGAGGGCRCDDECPGPEVSADADAPWPALVFALAGALRTGVAVGEVPPLPVDASLVEERDVAVRMVTGCERAGDELGAVSWAKRLVAAEAALVEESLVWFGIVRGLSAQVFPGEWGGCCREVAPGGPLVVKRVDGGWLVKLLVISELGVVGMGPMVVTGW